jgi:hypothetical protein
MNAEEAAVFLAAILYYVVRLIPEEDRSSRMTGAGPKPRS